MTALLPWEVRAGNDIERVRQRYPNLGILGGIDKTALTNKATIDLELEKAARMIAHGRIHPLRRSCRATGRQLGELPVLPGRPQPDH